MQLKKLLLILFLVAINLVMYSLTDTNYQTKTILEANFIIKDTIIPIKKPNVTTYSKLNEKPAHVGKYKKSVKTANVTSYSKLNENQAYVGKYKKSVKTANVTTYSKLNGKPAYLGKYKKLFKTANVTTYSKLNGKPTYLGKYKKLFKTANVTTYSKLNKKQPHVGKYKKSFKTANITSHLKIKKAKPNYQKIKKPSNTLNVTTYSKLTNSKTKPLTKKILNRLPKPLKPKPVAKKVKHTSSVSSHTKKEIKYKKLIYTKNVTSYSKIPESWNTKNLKVPVINVAQIDKINDILQNNLKPITSIIIHNDTLLDTAINIKNIDKAPIYPGCENKNTETDKKNCFFTKLATFTNAEFNASKFKNGKLKKGYNQIRVLFITDKKGNIITRKITGQWPNSILKETHRVMNLLPRVKPGYSNGSAVEVKFSFAIYFII